MSEGERAGNSRTHTELNLFLSMNDSSTFPIFSEDVHTISSICFYFIQSLRHCLSCCTAVRDITDLPDVCRGVQLFCSSRVSFCMWLNRCELSRRPAVIALVWHMSNQMLRLQQHMCSAAFRRLQRFDEVKKRLVVWSDASGNTKRCAS